MYFNSNHEMRYPTTKFGVVIVIASLSACTLMVVLNARSAERFQRAWPAFGAMENKMQTELEHIRRLAKQKIAAGSEPPWAWYQYMKLIETADAILDGMAATEPVHLAVDNDKPQMPV